MSCKKQLIQILVFLLIMLLTFYALFHGRDICEILKAVSEISAGYLLISVFLALLFVSMEGMMIWYLLRLINGGRGSSLTRCIQYSFIGFFYSGITPSATGGQPVQLYYMCRDGNKSSDSTVVLMTVAVIYKFVLVLFGTGILFFWGGELRSQLGRFFPLYLFGLFLNVMLVAAILAVMFIPNVIFKVAVCFISVLIRLGILKPSEKRIGRLREFICNYKKAVGLLKKNRGKIAGVVLFTGLQRCTVFLLTYVVYLGFGLRGESAVTIILLQASVYIAVDMLPLPGGQGITEMMYRSVFVHVFTGSYLIPSMLVSRGINFYFLLVAGLLVSGVNYLKFRKTDLNEI